MAFILIIDTALENGIVAIAKDTLLVDAVYNKEALNHAKWLHTAIDSLLKTNNLSFAQIDYIAVTEGPGSYTGLRIGMSAAKGLCFALNKPLLVISNLLLIAIANKQENVDLYIPMIDARRDEVFTSTYNNRLNNILDSNALILDANSFAKELISNKIIFCGNGAVKFQKMILHTNALFSFIEYNAEHIVQLVVTSIAEKNFANLHYSTPNYTKNVYIQSA
jgi:tRNA threonylcarbamoyladenosine biosynthesis protein TsaB